MDKLPTFDQVRYKDVSELRQALVACMVDRIVSDPVMLREYIREVVTDRVDSGYSDRMDLVEALYDEGYWE
jgi:hypothetical protein